MLSRNCNVNHSRTLLQQKSVKYWKIKEMVLVNENRTKNVCSLMTIWRKHSMTSDIVQLYCTWKFGLYFFLDLEEGNSVPRPLLTCVTLQ